MKKKLRGMTWILAALIFMSGTVSTSAAVRSENYGGITAEEKLRDLINAETPGAAIIEERRELEVWVSEETVLSKTIEIPTDNPVILRVRENILAGGKFPCFSVPEGASLTVYGDGLIMGGTDAESGAAAIVNRGTLIVSDEISVIGGGNTADSETNAPGGSLGGGGNSSAGSSSPGGGGGFRPGEEEVVPGAPSVPGAVMASVGGVAIENYGTLTLEGGKIAGGNGRTKAAAAIAGVISGGNCIWGSTDGENYTILTTKTPTYQYIYAAEGTNGAHLYMLLQFAKPGSCTYEVEEDPVSGEAQETVTLLSDVTTKPFKLNGESLPGAPGYEERPPLILDMNGHTLTVTEMVNEDGDPEKMIDVGSIELTGNGVINGDVSVSGIARILDGTINGGLGGLDAYVLLDGATVMDGISVIYGTILLQSGEINGIVTCVGSLQIDGGTVNGYIDGYGTEITINGGTIRGAMARGVEPDDGTIWVRTDDLTVNGGTIIGGVSRDGKIGYNAITLEPGNNRDDPAVILRGGKMIGGTGTESDGKAVEGTITKGENTVIKESDDGVRYAELAGDRSEKKYLKADAPKQYRINSITIRDSAGTELSAIPTGKFKATISFTNVNADEDTVLVFAWYSADGAFEDMMYVMAEDVPVGATLKLTLPVDNTAGRIASLKAFCWATLGSLLPMGGTVTFPAA